ncbi:MAG: hypothetical protein IPO69_22125 [Saprospiraceae bacterium]|nr:hypothetical protein [Saprospiraceae bacterium]
MEKYQKDKEDKLNTINRVFFDAEQGLLTLALERLKDLHRDFPKDAQVDYAEGLFRKDFLGQGSKAQELFLKALSHSTDRRKTNENYLFSLFNSIKYARNIKEFNLQINIARSLGLDDPDFNYFNEIEESLKQGLEYADILSQAVAQYEKNAKYGECASFADLAINCGNHSRDDLLILRKSRMNALRDLDRAAGASREVRGEDFPPKERLTLLEALKELEESILLDPYDHMLWNFKSAWLYIIENYDEGINAANVSINLCPDGYVKPRINKSSCLKKLGKIEEARIEIEIVLTEAEKMGYEGKADKELAANILVGLSAPPLSDHTSLTYIADRVTNAFRLTSQKEMDQWKNSSETKDLLKGLKKRVLNIGELWDIQYIKAMEVMLTFFALNPAL